MQRLNPKLGITFWYLGPFKCSLHCSLEVFRRGNCDGPCDLKAEDIPEWLEANGGCGGLGLVDGPPVHLLFVASDSALKGRERK